MHSYSVIRSICEDNDLKVCLIEPGAKSEYCTFYIKIENIGIGLMVPPLPRLYGSCFNEIITLGLAGDEKSKKTFDLHDPDSISKIENYILSMGCQ